MDPWGTPVVTGSGDDRESSIQAIYAFISKTTSIFLGEYVHMR